MKKILLLILISILTFSCGLFEEPNYYTYKPYTEHHTDNNDNTSGETHGTSGGRRGDNNSNERGNKDNNTIQTTTNNTDTVVSNSEPYVENTNLPSLTFNIYLYCQEKTNDTIKIISNNKGGIVYFNLYINNLSMSMYGFSIYDVDFYEFSDMYPYCGYSSFSLDTRYYAPYKMIVKPNNTDRKRYAHGYWAVNNGGSMYRAFHVILEQNF